MRHTEKKDKEEYSGAFAVTNQDKEKDTIDVSKTPRVPIMQSNDELDNQIWHRRRWKMKSQRRHVQIDWRYRTTKWWAARSVSD